MYKAKAKNKIASKFPKQVIPQGAFGKYMLRAKAYANNRAVLDDYDSDDDPTSIIGRRIKIRSRDEWLFGVVSSCQQDEICLHGISLDNNDVENSISLFLFDFELV